MSHHDVILLDRLPAQVGHVDTSGQCVLVHAAQRGHLNVLDFLLKNGDWRCTSCCGQKGPSKGQAVEQALTAAASMGHTEVRGHTHTHADKSCFIFTVCLTVID